MNQIDWQQFADAGVDHRNPHDSDVALVIHEAQKWAELELLDEQGRLS